MVQADGLEPQHLICRHAPVGRFQLAFRIQIYEVIQDTRNIPKWTAALLLCGHRDIFACAAATPAKPGPILPILHT